MSIKRTASELEHQTVFRKDLGKRLLKGRILFSVKAIGWDKKIVFTQLRNQ